MANSDKPAPRKVKPYIIYATVGFSMCFEIAVAGGLGWLVGNWLDKKFGIKPWGTTLGLAIFIGLFFVQMMKTLQKLSDRLDRDDKADSE